MIRHPYWGVYAKMIIRHFEPEDFTEVMKIETEAFSEHNPYIYMNFYEMNSDCFLVAEEHGRIAGFVAGYRISADEGKIFSLAVSERDRGYGIGSHLLEAITYIFMKKMLTYISLEVRASNLRAQGIYQKAGFIPCWVQHGYYSDGEAAIIMRKRLQPSNIKPAFRIDSII